MCGEKTMCTLLISQVILFFSVNAIQLGNTVKGRTNTSMRLSNMARLLLVQAFCYSENVKWMSWQFKKEIRTLPSWLENDNHQDFVRCWNIAESLAPPPKKICSKSNRTHVISCACWTRNSPIANMEQSHLISKVLLNKKKFSNW